MPREDMQPLGETIRKLRSLAEEARTVAETMKLKQTRDAMLRIAKDYEDIAKMLSRMASSC
jgi:hypothetical protein